ncbi:MAG TPA: RecX family transcriptional regulator [Candidatus Saccharimonadales bacterium]|nr:RecX family transcriptional regulator [Candidatus Saccharimonadales bacterium]
MKITAIKQQVKRAGRYSIYVDDKFAFGLSEAALVEQGLASGQVLTEARLRELQKAADLDKAYNNALRYVAMRPRSEWELREYFRRKGVDEDAGAQIAERLRRLGMLSDLSFARSWVTSRRLLKATSKRRLQLELKQKHVPDDVIGQVLAEDETDERTTLRELIAKKRARYPDDQKLMHYLARQGFNFDDIKAELAAGEEY